MRVWLLTGLLIGSFSLPAQAASPKIKGCGQVEQLSIRQALNWLRQNLGKFDQQMGQGGLSPWLGRSRDRLSQRLKDRFLVVSCAPALACDDKKMSSLTLGTWTLPIRHKPRIEVCTQSLSGLAQYVVVLAHELGHLVWANADRKQCLDRCTKPRFSDSLALAAYHVWHNTGHDAAQCPVLCGVKPAGIFPTAPGVLPPVLNQSKAPVGPANQKPGTVLEAPNSP